MDKMAANLNLGAYVSFLQGMGGQQRNLTPEEIAQARRMGLILRKTHGPPPGPRQFSGRDEAWLQIEGLGHKGISWQLRQEMTEFGSGWFSKLFGGLQEAVMGVPARIYAGRELGLGMVASLRRGAVQSLRTTKGETFYLGQQIGRGGAGEVWSAYSGRTARRAVYKKMHDPTAPVLEPGMMIGPGGIAGTSMALPAEARGRLFTIPQQEAVSQMRLGMTGLSGELEKQVGSRSAIGWEAMMQRHAAAEGYGAPRVLGQTNQGFVQEYAGRAIKTPEEAQRAAGWLRQQLKYQMATPGAPLHLDPHLGQVLVGPKGKFSLADWGYSIRTPVQLSEGMQTGLTAAMEQNIAYELGGFGIQGMGPRIWDPPTLDKLADMVSGKLASGPVTGAIEAVPQAWKAVPQLPVPRPSGGAAGPRMPGPEPQMPGMPPPTPPKRVGVPTNIQRAHSKRRTQFYSSHQVAVEQSSRYAANASKGHLKYKAGPSR
jgi:hypothetical protein